MLDLECGWYRRTVLEESIDAPNCFVERRQRILSQVPCHLCVCVCVVAPQKHIEEDFVRVCIHFLLLLY